jgi:ribosomal protein S18 acetylase RimI-like enzyme
MPVSIRPFAASDEDRVVEVALRAWEPVFASMADELGREIFDHVFGPDWRRYQEEDVRRACSAYVVSVAEVDGTVVGYTAVDLPDDGDQGEIYMLAVDPDHQGDGVGRELTEHGVELIRAAGKRLAVVGTGGDPGHARARATYERAGFTGMRSVQYYRLLEGRPPPGDP